MATRKCNSSAILCIASGIAILSLRSLAQQPVCPLIGKVKEAKEGSMSVIRGDELVRVQITSTTNIQSAGNRVPKAGDHVIVDCLPNSGGVVSARTISVNVVRYSGTITSLRDKEIRIAGNGGAGEALGHLRVIVGRSAHYVQGSQADLRRGHDVEVTGFNLGHNVIQATALNAWPQ